MKTLRLVHFAILASAVACSLPAIETRSSAATRTLNAATIDTAGIAPPIVQVRGFSHSAVVSVVAWDDADAEFGLRTSVNRSGELVGGLRFGDHSLYVAALYARSMGGFKYATDTLGHFLLGTGTRRDTYACFYGRSCSPLVSLGVRIPDALLRAIRDSLVVTFIPPVAESWTITVRRELIAAYLTKVDSVVADMRKVRTM